MSLDAAFGTFDCVGVALHFYILSGDSHVAIRFYFIGSALACKLNPAPAGFSISRLGMSVSLWRRIIMQKSIDFGKQA
jgi:hypothetical protein